MTTSTPPSRTWPWRVALAAVASLALALAACGDDDGADVAATPTSITAAATSSPGPSADACLPNLDPVSSFLPNVVFNEGLADEALLYVEIAESPIERATGLMDRECLAADWGMLFDFGQEQGTSFWMRDTLIPLSIAFVKADGTIVHIEDMEPRTDDSHQSPQPVRYAIEVNQGWFEDNGVGVGDSVDLDRIGE